MLTVLEIIFGVVVLLFSVAIILIVLLQEGQQQPMGNVTGGADTFLDKNRSRSADAFLERWTKFVSLGFMIAIIVMNAVARIAM